MPALHVTPSMNLRAAAPAAHVKARPAKRLRRRRAEFAKPQHADADVGQRARMHVLPFAAALRALEDVDVARIADHREQHV